MKHVALFLTIMSAFTIHAESDRRTMNQDLVRKLYESINTGRIEDIKALLDKDVEGGSEQFLANITSLREGFPDIRFTIEDLIAEGDRVAVRWEWTATHTGTFRGVAPTNKRIENAGIAIYQFRDGRIIRNWVQTDRLGALQQMGVLPSPGSPR